MSADIHAQKILILDFGSQYTQLIARRVREVGVYSEIRAFDVSEEEIREFDPRGIIRSGGRVVIITRSREKGERLAEALQADFKLLVEVREIEGQVLVNTTPVGMFPHAEQMPLDKKLLRPDLVVMDIIYNPLTTRLLSEAARTGCRTINGLSMFVYQGAVQFELWTGERTRRESTGQWLKRPVRQPPDKSGSGGCSTNAPGNWVLPW